MNPELPKYDLKQGIYFTLLSALSYSIIHLLASVLLKRFVLFQMIFLQNLVGFFLLTPFLSAKTKHWKTHLVRSFSAFSGYCFVFFSLRTLNLVDVMTLNHLFPFLVAPLGLWWLKESFAKQTWWAIGLGFIGTLIILNPTWNFFHLGGIFAIGSAIASAISFIAVRSLNLKGEPQKRILTYLFITGMIVSFPFALGQWSQPNFQEWMSFLLLGALTLLNQFFIAMAFKFAPAHAITPFGYSSLLFAGVFNWYFLGKPIKTESLLGALLILAGAMLICFSNSKRKQKEITS